MKTINRKTKSFAKFSTELTGTLQTTNNVLASVNTELAFRTHYVNAATGAQGIADLISSILTGNGAYFPANIAATSLRGIAIAKCLTVNQVIAAVRQTFGADRYPDATIYQYLSVVMFKRGIVGKIKLSNVEDKNRPAECFKPRTKFFVVQQPANA